MRFSAEIEDWSARHFGGIRLGDKRREERVSTVAAAFATRPGASIPRTFETAYEVKAAYNLFHHPDATPESLQSGHRALVRRMLVQPQTTLLLEDTSEIAWETGRRITGLGPVGRGGSWDQGFHLHSVLAVRWSAEQALPGKHPPLEVLGIADQQFYVRTPVPPHEAGLKHGAQWQQALKRQRESQLWTYASEHLGPSPEQAHWIRICDRAADIYEFLVSCRALGHDFVVRAAQNRALRTGGRLFESARAAIALGHFTLERRQRFRHPARTASLSVSAVPVELKAPQRPGHSQGALPPVACHAVRVWEEHPPAGEEPLEWILLVGHDVVNFDQALEASVQYASRWIVEDFHKALKTGLGAERLQLEDAHRLFAAISIMSVVALRLLDLRERLRIHPHEHASNAGLDTFELRVLASHLQRELKTVEDVSLAIGRLGGHMNRKSDGPPGLLALWHGIKELQALVAGARLGLQFNDLGKD